MTASPTPPSPARQRLVTVLVILGAIAVVGGLAWLGSMPEDRAEGRHHALPQGTESSRHSGKPPAP